MTLQPLPDNADMLLTAINAKIDPIVRQLEHMQLRMENVTSNLATRSDLEALRKELVTRDTFVPEMQSMRMQITRLENELTKEKEETAKRMEAMKQDQLSKQDRFWIRLAQVGSLIAVSIAVFDLISHIKFLP